MNSYIKGKYRRTIFSSDSYIVGIFKITDASNDLDEYIDKTITFTGYFHELNDMDTYKFYGRVVNHDKYGEQFAVESYEREKPEDKDSIIEFLTSGLFKGIGKSKAKKIVDVLGKDSLDVILNNPSNLVLIPGITSKNANVLHDKLVEYEKSYNIIIKLSDLGFNTKEAMLIYNKYKEKSLNIIDNDIYNIVYDIDKINFKRIDYIVNNNNINYNEENRVSAAIIYILETLTNNYGHSYFSKEEIISYIPKVLQSIISDEIFNTSINNLIMDCRIEVKDNKYYLKEMYDSEVYIVDRINILQHEKDDAISLIDNEIENLEKQLGIIYNEEQINAIKSSITKKFLIITGGPGTGKTTILNGICELYRNINQYSYKDLVEKLVLLAPTGRAAKRISESCGLPASTIHRFLKWNKDTNKFQINEYNKSKAKFVIIDEASMIDTYLFANLLKGLSVNTKIVLIGDVDQLPSVGPGELLQDFIQSEKLNVIRLNTLYRQEEGSNIITFADNIKNGVLDRNIFNKDIDLTFIECNNDLVMSKISEISKTYIDYSYKDFQILAPMYKTINGIDNINKNLQNIFNKKDSTKKEITIGDELFREDDKVIQLTNMPDDNVYNGDIGIISKIVNKGKKEIYIDFDGNLVKYTPTNFNNFKKAYAISIHKSQGSEFDIVVIPIVKSFNKMLYRKLIYTAITRCKKNLFLIGDINALEYSINNTIIDIRRTSIEDFLKNGIK